MYFCMVSTNDPHPRQVARLLSLASASSGSCPPALASAMVRAAHTAVDSVIGHN